ncbi:MAG: 4-alpha-glucanotransferase [Acidobacteria bacterium]|nr:MAG: 4-alpha-glucanotransferase [Acidobacteriota bacterium]
MKFPRRSGILLHPTSLPGPAGIGDFGTEAYRFIDFLERSGNKLWQVLPLNPTGYGDSPFQCFSASAGNPLLISLETLVEQGVLSQEDLQPPPAFANHRVDYGAVLRYKVPILTKAAHIFLKGSVGNDGAPWTEWAADVAARKPGATHDWAARFAAEIEVVKYWQFAFFQQWQALRSYAHGHGILIIGDLPIYVAHDSADVWANRELFFLEPEGNPTKVAGVPPDYFSATGQLWGNPIYNWSLIKSSGYSWWIERFRAVLRLYDIVRIDHFRGFEAYWEVPASERTAMNGRWIKGPGAELFSRLQQELGELPIIAENLGVITAEVEQIRHQFGFPGMAILQFAFGNDPQGPSFRPHNYVQNLVAYTGTHDNDTTVGWWNSEGTIDSVRTPEDVVKEHVFARTYLGCADEPINWTMIRTVLASVANTAIIPLQDVLGLGTEARMNLPGTSRGNWRWRFRPDALSPELAKRLRELNEAYDR